MYFNFISFFFIPLILSSYDIFLLNIKERSDKKRIAIKQLQALDATNFTVFDAIDGRRIFKEGISKDIIIQKTKISDLKIEPSAIKSKDAAHFGCFASHLMLYNYIVINNITRPVLILEDDFLAEGNALKILEDELKMLPSSWGMYYAGHCESRGACKEYLPNMRHVCRSGKEVACTHAYVVNGINAANALLKVGNVKRFFLADMFAQKANLNRYVRFPGLFTQLKMYMKIEADIHSGGGIWSPLSNLTIVNIVKKELNFTKI